MESKIDDIFMQLEVNREVKKLKNKDKKEKERKKKLEKFLDKPLFDTRKRSKKTRSKGKKLRVSAQRGIQGFFTT